jgi:hypothetical protein
MIEILAMTDHADVLIDLAARYRVVRRAAPSADLGRTALQTTHH